MCETAQGEMRLRTGLCQKKGTTLQEATVSSAWLLSMRQTWKVEEKMKTGKKTK